MYFPFQNCQNLFYRTIIIEMANINVKQGSKTLLFPFLTPCDTPLEVVPRAIFRFTQRPEFAISS